MIALRTISFATALSVGLFALSACDVSPAREATANEQNAAVDNAARAAAADMHNQMAGEHERDEAMDDDVMNEHHEMDGMRSHNMSRMADDEMRRMNRDRMGGMGGNSMSNESMPMEKDDHM